MDIYYVTLMFNYICEVVTLSHLLIAVVCIVASLSLILEQQKKPHIQQQQLSMGTVSFQPGYCCNHML